MDHDGFHVEFLDTPLMHKGVDFGYRHLLVHKGNAFFTVLCEGTVKCSQVEYSEKRFSEFPNGSRTHDLPEYRLDALTTELWGTHGERGHILGSYV